MLPTRTPAADHDAWTHAAGGDAGSSLFRYVLGRYSRSRGPGPDTGGAAAGPHTRHPVRPHEAGDRGRDVADRARWSGRRRLRPRLGGRAHRHHRCREVRRTRRGHRAGAAPGGDVARARARGRGQDRVTFIEGDLFTADISEATVVTLYLSPSINRRLLPKLTSELRPGTRIVSRQFRFGTWVPDVTVRAEDEQICSSGRCRPGRRDCRRRRVQRPTASFPSRGVGSTVTSGPLLSVCSTTQ